MVKLPKPYYKWAESSTRPEGEPPSRFTPSHTEAVMPVVSTGECIRSDSCSQFSAELADGLCVNHWDDTSP